MTGKTSRNKGARGEREFAEMLSNELGQVVKRKLGQARDGGDDIQVGRFRIEVKRREKLAIEAWCKQVVARMAKYARMCRSLYSVAMVSPGELWCLPSGSSRPCGRICEPATKRGRIPGLSGQPSR
jgi:Holliday junction resolvase